MLAVVVGRPGGAAQDARPRDDREDHQPERDDGDRQHPLLGAASAGARRRLLVLEVLGDVVGGRGLRLIGVVEAHQRGARVLADLRGVPQHPGDRHRGQDDPQDQPQHDAVADRHAGLARGDADRERVHRRAHHPDHAPR